MLWKIFFINNLWSVRYQVWNIECTKWLNMSSDKKLCRCAQLTDHSLCTVFTVHCLLYTVHCAMCTVHCALSIVQCELFTVNCAMWTVECKLCTVDCAQSTVGRPIVDCALFSEHHALCIGAWILCTVHWVANAMQFFLYSVQQALDSWTFSFYTMGNRP